MKFIRSIKFLRSLSRYKINIGLTICFFTFGIYQRQHHCHCFWKKSAEEQEIDQNYGKIIESTEQLQDKLEESKSLYIQVISLGLVDLFSDQESKDAIKSIDCGIDEYQRIIDQLRNKKNTSNNLKSLIKLVNHLLPKLDYIMKKLDQLYNKAQDIKQRMYTIGIAASSVTLFTLGMDFGITSFLSTSAALSILVVGAGITVGSYFIAINKSQEIQIILSQYYRVADQIRRLKETFQ